MNRQLERGLGVSLVNDAGRAERDLWAISARLYRDGAISHAEHERRDVVAAGEPVIIRTFRGGV